MTAPPIADTAEQREVLSRIASPNDLDRGLAPGD
jgi:hypothetical protein